MSIKEHLGAIHYFTQLNNGDIITCSQDKTMKIINLKGENKYNIVQTLIGHNHWVCKVIEIRKDESLNKIESLQEINFSFNCIDDKTLGFK